MPSLAKGAALAPSSLEECISALAGIPLFAGLSTDELTPIAQITSEREVAPGTVLAEQGAIGDAVMIMLSGNALVQRDGRIIDEMHDGDFFGEMSLINNAPRNATVTASSPLHLLVMGSDDFCAMLEQNPPVSVKILRTVAARVAATHDPGTI